ARALGHGNYEIAAPANPRLHPCRAAEIIHEGDRIGHLGEVHPSTAEAYEIEGRVAAGEFDLASLVSAVDPWQLTDPSPYPAAEFDLAFEVDESVPSDEVVKATAGARPDLLEAVEVFDEYRGHGLQQGKKSLAIRYRFRATDHTLSTEQVALIRTDLIAAARGVDAILRGG
ncbi:MAG: phenylalanine--tRNA ligase subunit beta, partial [Actinomycetota bacterium]